MFWLSQIPAIVKIFLVLGIILTALKLKIPLSVSIIIGAVSLGIFFQMSSTKFINAFLEGALSLDTISLVFVVTGILILSSSMSVSGRLERIVESFRKLVGESRIALVTFPALIGLLPMPGGAVFSAPMVGAMTENSTLKPHHKTAINYWFRHIWEYWFPLYPGVILALSLTKIPPWKFILINFPMTLVSLSVGYFIILRNVSLSEIKHRDYSTKNVSDFINELIPILIMVFSLLFFGILFNFVEGKFNFKSMIFERTPIFIGLIISVSWVAFYDKLKRKSFKKVFLNKSIWEIGFLVIGVKIFECILKTSGGVGILKEELLNYKIPALALIMAIPFITGIITGIAMGFVGTSFPIVITLIGTGDIYAFIFIAFVFGFIGMMLSPVHLCLLLTKDYFKASLIKVYQQYLVPLSFITLVIAIVIFSIYRLFGM